MGESTVPDAKPRVGPGWFHWTFLLIPLLYVLSLGPALKLSEHNVVPYSLVDTLYRPVYLCVYKSQFLYDSMDWYLQKCWGTRLLHIIPD